MKDKAFLQKYNQERYNKLSWWEKRKENVYDIVDCLLPIFGCLFIGFITLLPFAWFAFVVYIIVHLIRKFW